MLDTAFMRPVTLGLVWLLCACSTSPTAPTPPRPEIDTDAFVQTLEATLDWRARAMRYVQHLQTQGVLSSDTITTMHITGTDQYAELRTQLYGVIQQYKWVTDRQTIMSFTTQATHIQRTKEWSLDMSLWRDDFHCPVCRTPVTHIAINPNDALGRQYVRLFKMLLSATLTLYDNYLLVISDYDADGKIRQLLNRDNPKTQGLLHTLGESYHDLDNLKRTARAIILHKNLAAWYQQQQQQPNALDQYFDTLIEASYTYRQIPEVGLHTVIRNNTTRLATHLFDTLTGFKTDSLNEISKIFGNTLGLVEFRKGKLSHLTQRQQDKLAEQLQPLDILLEKTPFRATDKFIPGHWGHVAIWVGSPAELQALGLWEHPLIQPHQTEITHGKRIIEALRGGVVLNTFAHFLNIDDLAVMRLRTPSTQTKTYLLNAFKQLGKEYDFNFDVETDNKIVCSELAYVTYADLTWPTVNQLGRATISPDNVAKLGLTDDAPFKPILLYHDGEPMPAVQQNFGHLFRGQYTQLIR